MSDRYAQECERRARWEGDTGQGEVDLLIPKSLLVQTEERMREPDAPEGKLYTGHYL
jgi:hypothetical protein